MKIRNQSGFSLTELLVVVAITGIVSTAIMAFFMTQQRSHSSQEQVTLVQQNARAGLGVMSRELRMAGYNPLRPPNLTAFSDPGLNKITFYMYDSPGTTLDTITYTHFVNAANDQYDLRRNGQAMAEGIAAVAFAYAYDSNEDGVLEPAANTYAIAGANGLGPLDGTINWFRVNANGSTTDTGTKADAADIRAVKIWLLARAESDSQDFTNTTTYIVGTQTVSPTTANLHRRHLLLETVVRCRNMGL